MRKMCRESARQQKRGSGEKAKNGLRQQQGRRVKEKVYMNGNYGAEERIDESVKRLDTYK